MKAGRAIPTLVVAAAWGCGTEAPPPLGPLSGIDCAVEASESVREWGGGDVVFPTAPDADGRVAWRFPTDALGEWIVVEELDAGSRVSRLAAGSVDITHFDAGCSAERTTEQLPASPTGAFTDGELVAILEAATADGGAGVVVYLWSPHMPLSVDGWRDLRAAAAEVGLTSVPLLAPGSDQGFASREAMRLEMPEEAIREPAMLELSMRDATTHSPTVVVFTPTAVSAPLPGQRGVAGYVDFFRRFLQASDG